MTAAECRRVLDSALAAGGEPRGDEIIALAGAPPAALDEALRDFAESHGAAALELLNRLAEGRHERGVRRGAKRALYRLSQRGIARPRGPTPRPVVMRQAERAVRAWLSAIDGTGSRATWIVFETAFGGLELASLILSDTIGIVEVAGGEISKKRLASELQALRRDQKLPWVETEPQRALGLVAEALALHRASGTPPPGDFARWRPRFETATPVPPPRPPANVDETLVERAADLLDLPEMAGWFLDPEAVGGDAVELLQARDSRLVVSEQLKAEREAVIVVRVAERELHAEARARWARRLLEMALVFRVLDRQEDSERAEAAAGALLDLARPSGQQPFARALSSRGLELAGEVALGRVSAAEVSRKPGPVTRP